MEGVLGKWLDPEESQQEIEVLEKLGVHKTSVHLQSQLDLVPFQDNKERTTVGSASNDILPDDNPRDD